VYLSPVLSAGDGHDQTDAGILAAGAAAVLRGDQSMSTFQVVVVILLVVIVLAVLGVLQVGR
jgi:hypothetical protein